MDDTHDTNGQPREQVYNWRMVESRGIDEIIGLCKGVLADGAIVQAEAEYLLRWLETNKSIASQWPANILYKRIREMLIDQVMDEDEEEELVKLLCEMTGTASLQRAAENMSTSLPLDDPAPPVRFDNRTFCLTGKFVFGSRRQCEAAVTERRGTLHTTPTRKTEYLIIGLIGSRDWIHSTFGRKIEKAVRLRESSAGIKLVSEKHWAECMHNDANRL